MQIPPNLSKLLTEMNHLGSLNHNTRRLIRPRIPESIHFRSRITASNNDFKNFMNKFKTLSEVEITDISQTLTRNMQRIINEITFDVRLSKINELYLENANDPNWQNEFEKILTEMNALDYEALDSDVLYARLDEMLIVLFDMNQLITENRNNLKISDLADRATKVIKLLPKYHSNHFAIDFLNWVESKRNQFVDQKTLREADTQLQEIEIEISKTGFFKWWNL